MTKSEAPRFRGFRTREAGSVPSNGNKSLLASRVDTDADRQANVKRAAFFVAVAVIFVLVNHLASRKNASDENLSSFSLMPLGVSISVRHHVGLEAGPSMLFRFANTGKHSVFYAASEETNAPFGQTLARTSASAKWITPSGVSEDQSAACEELVGKAVAWIEMPPGGWLEGGYQDVGDFAGEHAYAIFVKPSQERNVVRVFSNCYRSEGR